MNKQILLSSLLFITLPLSATDWSQPEIGCVEEMVPQTPNRPCLDYSQTPDIYKDWPPMSQTELQYWQTHKRQLAYCRAQEIQRRELVKPGSQNPGQIESSWMISLAVQNSPEKVDSIYQASEKYGIPPMLLMGALYQESLLAELGIAEDGGNFSCGVGQVNLVEWCNWANQLTSQEQKKIDWTTLSCSSLSPGLLKSFYKIALKNLNGEPEYKLMSKHFSQIRYSDVADEFPSASEATQRTWFQATQSFLRHCSKPGPGISANANSIARLFRNAVPAGMRATERYAKGDEFRRSCRSGVANPYYPLHTGWLMAVGMYNAGSRVVDALAHYNQWSSKDLLSEKTFNNFGPQNAIESLYWAGEYNSATDKIHFSTLSGGRASWIWYKQCVLQRHIARVIQAVTLGGAQPLATSLEGKNGCSKSEFDPATGRLIKTSVPPERQVSSGVHP